MKNLKTLHICHTCIFHDSVLLSNAFLTTPDEFENKDKMQKKILETPWERSWEQNSVLVEIYLTIYVKKHLNSFPGSLFSASPKDQGRQRREALERRVNTCLALVQARSRAAQISIMLRHSDLLHLTFDRAICCPISDHVMILLRILSLKFSNSHVYTNE